MRPLLLVTVLVAGSACSAEPGSTPAPNLARPPRPTECREVRPGEPLATALAEAPRGAAVCLAPGTWVGRVVVPEGVTLWGSTTSVIKTDGEGSTVTVSAGAALLGLTVDGSGGRFDLVDAAVRVGGEGGVVAGVTVRSSPFGILVEKAQRVQVRGNHVVGTGGEALGLRGDGIRLWETRDSLVEDNVVEESRDFVVWYSSGNTLRRNVSARGRYGMHFMYSHDNLMEANTSVGNEVGVFVMYSRGVTVRGNALLGSRGAAGMGIGLKESGNVTVTGNQIAGNTLGIFLDDSPLTDGDRNLVAGNEIRLNDVGVVFLASDAGNTFRGNSFVDNFTSVRVDGGGDVLSADWTGNYWSEYAGYDLDRDGIGDVPFELADLSDALVSKYPSLTFLRGTPSLALVSLAGEVAPLLAPKTLLRDPAPRFTAPDMGEGP